MVRVKQPEMDLVGARPRPRGRTAWLSESDSFEPTPCVVPPQGGCRVDWEGRNRYRREDEEDSLPRAGRGLGCAQLRDKATNLWRVLLGLGRT